MNPETSSPLSPKAARFVHSVTELKPKLAVFDCDGTLWSVDSGEGFMNWEFAQNLLSNKEEEWLRQRYATYRAGKVSEDQMCGEMVTVHRGLTEAEVERAAIRYFDQNCLSSIFPEMRQLINLLHRDGCDIWVVSSTNEWVIRAAMRHFGIAPEKILAASVRIVDGKITDHLLRVPSGPAKPVAIKQVIGRTPDAVFGNSIWDVDMLLIARHGFAVNPTKQLENTAKQRAWPIYWPEGL